MNARPDMSVTARVVPLRRVRRRLAEASIIPLGTSMSAIVFNVPGDGTRPGPRLTALCGGEPLRGTSMSTSLELLSGGRRYVLFVGRSAESLTGMTITLALGAELAAIVDGDWLQPPLADEASLVAGLAEAGRRRLLKLFLTTGASLFGRGAPGFSEAARRFIEASGSPTVSPASQCNLGALGSIVSYRVPGSLEAGDIDDLVAVRPDRLLRVEGWQAMLETSGAGCILHVFLPGRTLDGGDRLVGLGRSQIQLLFPGADLPAQPLVPWLERRTTATRTWAETLMEPSAPPDPGTAALIREMRHSADAPPRVVLRHLSATRGGILLALNLTDDRDLVRAIRLERGGASQDVAIDGSGLVTSFVPLPRQSAHEDACRIQIVYHSRRLASVHEGALEPYVGQIPFEAAGPAAATAIACAGLDLERVRSTEGESFGASVADASFAIVSGVDENLDIIRARAAMLAAELQGSAVELIYYVTQGSLAAAARAALAQAAAVYGLPHRLVSLPPKATAADGLLAALETANAPRLLILGPDVLPAARGWLATLLAMLGGAQPMLGGTLIDIHGSVLDCGRAVVAAGAKTRRRVGPRVGWPAHELSRISGPTSYVSADCVGLNRTAVNELLTVAHYPDPDVMLACVLHRLRQQGFEARTLYQTRFTRYGRPRVRGSMAEAVDAQALDKVLKPFFRSASDQGQL